MNWWKSEDLRDSDIIEHRIQVERRKLEMEMPDPVSVAYMAGVARRLKIGEKPEKPLYRNEAKPKQSSVVKMNRRSK